ncbi:MAG: aspartate dehydrogenase [Pseudomonadota bacterium]|nr:aspartate dehydrogenase [Pseudomonadota bacterium]
MKVGIAGFGSIGKVVGEALDIGIENLTLSGVCGRNYDKTKQRISNLKFPPLIMPAQELAEKCEVIVECVPKAAFLEIAEPVLKLGKLLITVSGAGILANPQVIDLAKNHGGRIILATGALLGLDAVRAAAEGDLIEVKMITRKPPNALRNAPYLLNNNISIENLKEPKKVFEGSAKEGAAGFPANVNVAAALGLAGFGADRTELEIWADPSLTRNTHAISVDSDSAKFYMKIENIQSNETPGTGKITALSVIACLRGLAAPLKVGS